jgi:D-2-hydroxyacid dehydrogenase (NADP+)
MEKHRHVLLVAREVLEEESAAIHAIAGEAGLAIDLLGVPPDGVLTEEQLQEITLVGVTPELSGPLLDMKVYEQIHKMPRLRFFSLPLVGTDWAFGAISGLRDLYERGCVLSYAPGYNAIPVAQHAVAGLLALWARIPTYLENQRQHRWVNTPNNQKELGDQTAVVFGFGSIGREIGRLLRAIGLRVIGVRRTASTEPEDEGCVDEIAPPTELQKKVAHADWLIVTVPHTPQTERAVNSQIIDAMPVGAGLINVGRGAVVDEAAVNAALRTGQLGCAYLDVFSEEPLPVSSSLWQAPNLLMSPHDGWYSTGNARRCRKIFLTSLRQFCLGEVVSTSFGPPQPLASL